MQPLDHTSPASETTMQASRGKPIPILTFDAQPLDLRFRSLVNMDFVASRQLVRPWRLRIQFLFVGSHLCSTLPSNPTSR